ncbi:uncharacterized protein METZ01_LOCUS125754 [marine metagenome]|uniref:Uncharacterized protein n=1 Tax=marine metagenome TaxID=408172 RepID=A0A381Y7L7_9ZZZZ
MLYRYKMHRYSMAIGVVRHWKMAQVYQRINPNFRERPVS